jgi:hypothetical protein
MNSIDANLHVTLCLHIHIHKVWDNSAADGSVHALAGFVFDEKHLAELAKAEKNPQTLKGSAIMRQMVAIFGAEAAEPSQIFCKVSAV